MYRELSLARKLKGFSQKDFATKIAMDQTTYSRKENGKSIITEDEWTRMASALSLEVSDIKQDRPVIIKNENCTFNDSSIGIKYVAIPEDVLETLVKYSKKLECEIEKLKNKLGEQEINE